MPLQADFLLEKHLGNGLKALRRFFLFLAEILLDRMTHHFGFAGSFGLGFDAKPGFAVRGVADVLHASSWASPTIPASRRTGCAQANPDAAPLSTPQNSVTDDLA